MMLRVGPYLYRVEPVHGYINHQGKKCLGLCDNDRHVLLVSDVATEAQQVQVICHEYIEAWLHHFGREFKRLPGKEALCDLFGLAMTQFALDFIHEMRHHSQPPDPAPPPPTDLAPMPTAIAAVPRAPQRPLETTAAPAFAKLGGDGLHAQRRYAEASTSRGDAHIDPLDDGTDTQWHVTVFEPIRPDPPVLAAS